MRVCRVMAGGVEKLSFYHESGYSPLEDVARAAGLPGDWIGGASVLDCLRHGAHHARAAELFAAFNPSRAIAGGQFLVPIPRPNKLFLLAGNYAEHVREAGEIAAEREETFPYVFMKPASTTLNDPYQPVRLPAVSPGAIDWELELGVIIGRKCKSASAEEALAHVAGYTIINDISNRRFRPNPGRKKRERDAFFDWLHGKWFDGFCPAGPCALDAGSLPDPQSLGLQLRLNGQTMQDSHTSKMIFPVSAIIEFISSMATLEPGDIISTGTPAGVGHSSGTFLKPGDLLRGTIERIGDLVTVIAAEVA
ncbi:MAG: fumarylacetoacetate hydrolase family protein [Planctomycetes bacterium]|nr:fumarylacetoacetate hydrolase family protein [Planctomycetota bacterium]